jgi:hypothetical protein
MLEAVVANILRTFKVEVSTISAILTMEKIEREGVVNVDHAL